MKRRFSGLRQMRTIFYTAPVVLSIGLLYATGWKLDSGPTGSVAPAGCTGYFTADGKCLNFNVPVVCPRRVLMVKANNNRLA